jgi:uncharacterized protein
MIPLLEPHTAAITATLNRIPPLWPLKHFVAVNPFSGLTDLAFTAACELLERTTGAAPLLSPKDYLNAYQNGEINTTDLAAAASAAWSPDSLLEMIQKNQNPSPSKSIATVADLLDRERPRAHWSVFITEEISKWCAVTFDENQTTWCSPWQGQSLYDGWRSAALHDRNPEAFGIKNFRKFISTLSADSAVCIQQSLELLSNTNLDLADFFHRQLASISGWAGYVQYLVREDVMRGKENPALQDLLAIRLAYDAALFQAFAADAGFRQHWKSQTMPVNDTKLLGARVCWQHAYEHGYQRKLASLLSAQPSTLPNTRPSFQAIFCIDVRSEVFRRHLEAAAPSAQTIGFAGFFGFPIAHRPAGMNVAGTRCPVLLVPPVETCEFLSADQSIRATVQRAEAGAWKAFQNSAASCFSFVESAGLIFGAALGQRQRTPPSFCASHSPSFADGDAESMKTRASMAEGALRNMSLTQNFARLVLICGHGSQSANNPYASGLDCGACGGHAGDVNARLAANALNDSAVRGHLAANGIQIPADTCFIAGLHNTTTDGVELFDTATLPQSHAEDLTKLRVALTTAGAAALLERAPSLGLEKFPASKLAAEVNFRAADSSQVRPEWGLANNAALIAAPRSRSAALKLDGRVFLHDYDATSDPENKVLTLILCAPVVVASWINLQYYASRIDQQRYGSGNKTLHNVAGGLGVYEGNGGDLRSGLPLQSLHDGEKYRHEPRRLSVFIEAARTNLMAVLDAQAGVKALFDNGWISLFALEGEHCHRYAASGWIEENVK